MLSIAQDIKNNIFKRVYLLYGEETYLRLQYRDKLIKALVNDGDTMNYYYHEGKDVNVGEVIDMAETMPFLAEYRVIVLENPDFNKEDGDKLAEYILTIPESTVIIIVEAEVDKRTKLFKAVSKAGKAAEFPIQSDETLKKWVMGKFKAEGKQATMNTLDVFLDMVGTDMANIVTELEKLFSYTIGKDVIEVSDVKAVCTVTPSSRVFDMIDLMADRQTDKALDMYHELISMKQSPFGILALIARQYNLMLRISEMHDMPDSMIASKLGMSPYVVKKYYSKIKKYTTSQLRAAVKRCVETDEAIKYGNLEQNLAVEMLIIEESTL